MQSPGLRAKAGLLAGIAILGTGLLNIVIGQKLAAQESLGEKARRIRAQRDNAQAGQSADGKKQMSPAAAALTATVGLVQETDPEKYQEGVRLMLEQERFRVLEDVAAGERTNKTRFAGGEWKLWMFFNAIATPKGKGRSVSDWSAYRDRMSRWVGQQPEAVTARLAMAQAELLYGWELRGAGELGTIPQDRFDRFMAQVRQAETILNGASELQVKCPEWYDVMLQVARAKGWELQDMNTLLERAG